MSLSCYSVNAVCPSLPWLSHYLTNPAGVICNRFDAFEQADPMVNVQRTTNGKAEHVKAINCKGHENDMTFLADMLMPYVDTSVKFVVADVYTSGVVRIIEHRYPWYVVVCGFASSLSSCFRVRPNEVLAITCRCYLC